MNRNPWRTFSLAAVAATVIIAGALLPAWADSIPAAMSTVSVICTPSAEDSLGPLDVPLSAQCEGSGTVRNSLEPNQSPYNYVVAASVDTDFGPAMPLVGNVAVSTQSSVDSRAYSYSLGGSASAVAHGSVTYAFVVEAIGPAPFSFLPMVYFRARAEGSVSRFRTLSDATARSTFLAFAALPAAGVDWRIGGTQSTELEREAYFELAANDAANPSYAVILEARCSSVAGVNSYFDGTAEKLATTSCHAEVDPEIRLDQGAFDAAHGASSFPLEDYYRIVFSPNVSVPEPASVWLLLGGMMALARRKLPRQVDTLKLDSPVVVVLGK